MKIKQFYFANNLRNFSYLIHFDQGDAFCIDPYDHQDICHYIKKNNLKLKGVLITHDHFDHHQGLAELLIHNPCPVYTDIKSQIPYEKIFCDNGMPIYQFERWSISCLATPGHTMTHLAFILNEDENPLAIFTGDCLFNAGVGNCHHGGNVHTLFETIQKMEHELPNEILIYPGHDYLENNLKFTLSIDENNHSAQTILATLKKSQKNYFDGVHQLKTEKEINLFFKNHTNVLRKYFDLPNASNEQIFVHLREKRNSW